MKKFFYNFMLFILICTSCSKSIAETNSDAGKKFLKNFGTFAYDKYTLVLLGEGGAFSQGISNFYFYFISKDMMDLDEARRFYFLVLDVMLEMINSDEKLRPYLTCYPFTHRNIALMIVYYANGEINHDPEPPYISMVSAFDDKIGYHYSKKYCQRIEPHVETIQRARGIIQHQDNQAGNLDFSKMNNNKKIEYD